MEEADAPSGDTYASQKFGSSRPNPMPAGAIIQEPTRNVELQPGTLPSNDDAAQLHSYSSYTRVRVLGRGQMGRAVLIQSPDRDLVVAKEIVIDGLSDEEKRDMCNEIEILQRLSHPHIVRCASIQLDTPGVSSGATTNPSIRAQPRSYHCFFVRDGMMNIVMECAPPPPAPHSPAARIPSIYVRDFAGTCLVGLSPPRSLPLSPLSSLSKLSLSSNGSHNSPMPFTYSQPPLPLPYSLELFAHCYTQNRYQYVHSHRVLHRDLSSGNILLSGSNTLKLSDFGIARSMGTQARHFSRLPFPRHLHPSTTSM